MSALLQSPYLGSSFFEKDRSETFDLGVTFRESKQLIGKQINSAVEHIDMATSSIGWTKLLLL
jgi:hypothetical protein